MIFIWNFPRVYYSAFDTYSADGILIASIRCRALGHHVRLKWIPQQLAQLVFLFEIVDLEPLGRRRQLPAAAAEHQSGKSKSENTYKGQGERIQDFEEEQINQKQSEINWFMFNLFTTKTITKL